MTESELFAAYRTPYGYMTTCACGELIEAESADEHVVAGAIAVHQESTVHEHWRLWQESLASGQRPVKHVCPCNGHVA